MKKYIAIAGGVVVLSGLAFWGYKVSDRPETALQEIRQGVAMQTVSGEVSRFYEGENVMKYSFQIPESATTTVAMNGALIKVTHNGVPYASMYMSYEGGRGYGPIDYLGNIVAPHVSVINTTGVETIGTNNWQVAESEGSVWHVASVLNDQWLIVVENKKSEREMVEKTLASVSVE